MRGQVGTVVVGRDGMRGLARRGQHSGRALPSVRSLVLIVAGIAACSLTLGITLTWRLSDGAEWTPHLVRAWPLLPVLGLGSYGFRFLRWHLLAKRRAPELRLAESLRIYMTGFSLGLTPGRVGELLKFVLLRQATGVPEAQSVAILPVEAITEAASFLLVALAGAAWGGYRLPDAGRGAVAAVVALPALALLGFLRRRWRGTHGGKAATATELPTLLQNVLHGLTAVGGVRPLLLAMSCALAARASEVVLFSLAARTVGFALSPAAAMLVWSASGLVGGLSFLPGGVGAVEGAIVATVVEIGGPASLALAAALLSRLLTLWLWIPVGLWFAVRSSRRPGYPASPKASAAVSVIKEPIASEEVAAGDGAFRT